MSELNHLLQPDHYDSLTGELKCICGTYLKPPILLCTKGHSSCMKCRRKYKKCTTCKESFTETRSIILEALADKLHFPCSNSGCEMRLALSNLDEHGNSCPHRITPCLMANVYGECDWKGKAIDWLNHCIKSHKNRVTDLPFVSFNDAWSPKNRNPVMRYHLMRSFDRVFNIYQIYDTKSGKMMWAVIATGESAAQNSSYFFDLEIFNPDKPMRKISFRQPCKSENDTDILEASQNVLIPLEQIMYMLDKDGHLHFNLRVSESKNADVTELIAIKL